MDISSWLSTVAFLSLSSNKQQITFKSSCTWTRCPFHQRFNACIPLRIQFGLVHYFTKIGAGEYYLEELEETVCEVEIRYHRFCDSRAKSFFKSTCHMKDMHLLHTKISNPELNPNLCRKRKLLERKVRRDMGVSENDDYDSCSDYDDDCDKNEDENDEYDRNVSMVAVAQYSAYRIVDIGQYFS